ncbi:arrestin domain-containing 3-like [Brachionus plicatilis]|uniref:Arrestin domain-containing 3-like n=1 Tax=Brachionus plicatilis TaxID=10195 RepID=A0A3M7S6C2_BRAPC|nr:arrestin domain-containing 3-like [Brachionus plicatilis]
MGRIENLNISFLKPNPVYKAGDTIQGSVNFRVNEPTRVNRIKLRALGKAIVHWIETQEPNDDRHIVTYESNEIYLNEEIILYDKENDDQLFNSDDYSFDFFIQLPNNAPTSFEHEIGQIRYNLNAKIEIPWAFGKSTKKSFTVISEFDLNEYPSLRLGLGVSDEKYLCCWPCRSSPIIANFSLLKGGYVPGEGIVFDITINNRTNKAINCMNVSLVQKIKFRANFKTKTSSRTVENFRFPSRVQEKSILNWNNSVLVIPPTCPTSNKNSKIIDISYLVLFDFCASGPHFPKEIAIPISIGTIPLKLQNENQQQNGIIDYEESKFGPYPDKILFHESEFEDLVEIENEKFKPLYPFLKDN